MKRHQNALRNFLAASTAAAIVVTAAAPAATAAELPFTDVSGHYTNGVGYLYTNGIVNGTSTTTYGTNNNIKRGDTAVIISRALNADTEKAIDNGFTDVGRYAPAVNALFADGIINGISETEFNPNGTLTRGAMAKILVEAYDIPAADQKSPFKDAVGVFGEYVDALYAAGITGGKSADLFGTNNEITRGEFAVLLYKTMNKFGDVVKPEITVAGVNDGMITNTATQTLTVEASEGSDVKVLLNYQEVTATEEGTYDIVLEEGRNIITVSASSFGVETDVTKTVTLDTVAPALSLSGIPDVVNSAILPLEFETEPGSLVEVSLNGEAVSDAATLTLAEGENAIVITVVEASGNKTVIEKVVTYVDLVKEAEKAVTALEESTKDLSTQEKVDAANELAADAETAIAALPENDGNIELLTTRLETAKSAINEAVKKIEIVNAKADVEAAISALPETITLEDKQAVYEVRAKVNEALKLYAEMKIEGLSKLEAAELKLEELVFDAATIRLDAAQATIKTNKTYQLTATITPVEAEDFNVEWSSDNEAVATVDENGLVTSITEGTANITATLENGKTDVFKFTVSDRPALQFSIGSTSYNGLITSLSTSFYNLSDETITVKSVQLYEGTTEKENYSEEYMQSKGVPTEITPYGQFQLGVQFGYLGRLKESEGITIKHTIQIQSGKTYEYTLKYR
ncbi:S-layer homology domain-containing protein [Bacillus sp. ISL-41]|uniref:S-layer homology domain-containing protein n=1 Tax=Bacillus sp. ISL-41 TaxID=2819127 RepID=UPI001BE8C277|nr:S-layer homology domain-containing protein [Bacillus sp. ISL-41]MBT2641695.1 S-layer homology domain-containing protein [Bacillus sp. ISL-41]